MKEKVIQESYKPLIKGKTGLKENFHSLYGKYKSPFQKGVN